MLEEESDPTMVTSMRGSGIEAIQGGCLSYDHEGTRPNLCTAATPFITCLTSGRPSHSESQVHASYICRRR